MVINSNLLTLLKARRFLPLFLTQFMGAFNDSLFRNALILLITYKIAAITGARADLLAATAGGLFILPFFIFSATAGELADKYTKSKLIVLIKAIEVLLVSLAIVGLYKASTSLLFTCLFLMGTHSAFFGPVKYAILPEQLQVNELVAGNAWIEASTFIAILLGTILGGFSSWGPVGLNIVSSLLFLSSIVGFAASFFIPKTPPAQPSLEITANIFKKTIEIVRYSKSHKDIFLAILGISWLWLVGALILAEFPSLVRKLFQAEASVVTLILAMFTIGMAIGSLLSNKLLKGKISINYVPLGILGMTAFMLDLGHASSLMMQSKLVTLLSLKQFLHYFNAWRVLADVFLLAVCGGLYVVPLYALIQHRAEPAHRARVIACNNIINSLFMVISAIIAVILLSIGLSIVQLLLVVAAINAVVAFWICLLLPDALVRSFVRWFLLTCYRVKVTGLENYEQAGKRVIILANHTSFLDVILLAAFLPNRLTFAVNTHFAEKWWMQWLLKLVEAFKVDANNAMSMKSLIKAVRNNRRCVIFPEGRLTVTGALMKIYEGTGLVADKSDAVLLPIRIEGAQYTPLSRLKGKVRLRWFPQISLKILPPQQLEVPAKFLGRKRRQFIGMKLYDLMTEMMFKSSEYEQTLFAGLLDARTVHGGRHIIAEDIERKPVNYNQLIARCFILGEHIARQTERDEAVGILLPNMVSTVTTFFALQAFERVPAMLNFSSGANNILVACKTAQLKQVYTARRFIEAAKLENTIAKLVDAGIKINYLDDLRGQITLFAKLKGLLAGKFARYIYQRNCSQADAKKPAVILFTSGSEGVPKGVMLSHENIQANRFQVSARIAFNSRDIVFSALPIFHAFGLTVGTVLPLLSGIHTFFYPSPLHYRIVPELVYDTGATIMFGTDTFLLGYGRYAHPYDFYSLRYVFAGAERLKDRTRELWADKFGLRILEGYGATETAPVISTNTPMQFKKGTVGRFLNGIEYRLESVPGIEKGGRLFVRGPSIMLGYLLYSLPGQLQALTDGWYDTGDIVFIDEQGYITILDRAKRFAKIGGEMISLTSVEGYITDLWSNFHHAVLSTDDPKKGEQLILITDYPQANREEIISYVNDRDISNLVVPRQIKVIDDMPLLATGKIDYVAVKELV